MDSSEIKIDVVIYRGRLRLLILHFASVLEGQCCSSLLKFTSQLQRHMLIVVLWIHRLTSGAMVSLKPASTLLKLLLWPCYHVK